MTRIKDKNILHVNIFFLIMGIILLFIASFFQAKEIYSGLLITEYGLILIPSLMYIWSKDLSFKETLKLNKISFKQIAYVFGISLAAYPIAVFLNAILLSILSIFGDTIQSGVPLPDSPAMYMLSIFVIAISPGICEEVMFRGVIMNAYEEISKRKAIIYSAILFGLFHVNIQNLVGPIILGLVFGIIVYKTNSIYASIFAHIFNNGIAISLGYIVTRAENSLLEENEMAMEMVQDTIPGVQLLMSLIFMGIFAFFAYRMLIKLIRDLPKGEGGELISLRATEEIKEIEAYNSARINKLYYIPIGIFLIVFVYLNILVTFV